MSKTIIHPIRGAITYEIGDLYKSKFVDVFLPWQYRKLVVCHEERIERLKADNYTTKGLKTKDEKEYRDELTIIDYWRAVSEIRLDTHGTIIGI